MSPEGVAWRKAVLRRDRKRCRLCQAASRLEAHHIYPYALYVEKRWEVSNGITLCQSCHRRFQGKEMDNVETLSIIATLPAVG